MKNTRIRSGAIMKQITQNGDRQAIPDNSVGTSKVQDLAITYNKLSAEIQSLLFQTNLIDNPEGFLFQRTAPGTPTTINDDAFGPDRWNILCSANGVAISRSTDAPDGAMHSIKLDKATGSGQFGMIQMKESRDSIPLRNKTINWTGSVKTESSEVTEVRVSILGWTSTADTITSDVVSSWASLPTYIANVVEYATTTLLLTNSYQEFSLNAAVGGTCNNLMFFIHTTNSEAVGDSIFVSAMRSYKSISSVPYFRRRDSEEITICERFVEKSYALDIAPGTNVGDVPKFTYAYIANGQNIANWISFRTTKRAIVGDIAPAATWDAVGNLNRTSIFNAGNARTDNVNGGSMNYQGVGYGGFLANEATLGATTGSYGRHWIVDVEL